jgi:hypothetical protein
MFRRNKTGDSVAAFGDSDTGQERYPTYGTSLHTNPLAMVPINGREGRKLNRLSPETDVDMTPWLARRYTNMSVTDVQLNNGLHNGIASGKRWSYRGTGYLYASNPIIPGQTRDNVAGFHRRGPSPYNVQDVWESGPGAQPEHPQGGGPGKIAAPTFINPMSG